MNTITMPYCNPLTTIIYEEIAQCLTIPFINENHLRHHVDALDYDAICAIDDKKSTLLHNTLRLTNKKSSTCCFIVTILIQKAMQIDIDYRLTNGTRKNATEFLLTQQNAQGQSPYYQALLMHADSIIVQTCAQWLSFCLHLKYISVEHYLHMHQNPKNFTKLIGGGYASELKTCLEELNDAKKHRWISHQQYQQLFLSLGSTATKQLEMVCKSECRETIFLLFIWLIIDYPALLKPYNSSDTLIHSLIDEGKDKQAKAVLFAVCDAIDEGAFPGSVIGTILLHSNYLGFRLLDRALKTGHYTTLELLVNIAELAFEKQWIHVTQYNHFLINHAHYAQGFSPLHEVLISQDADIECMLLYVNAILKGVINERISLDQCRALLTQFNSIGCQPIHQAIKNSSFEKTFIFLNMFKWLFSQYEYDEAILSRSNRDKKIICSNEYAESKKINEFVLSERKQAIARLHQRVSVLAPRSSLFTLVKPSHWSANFINFISLINQVLCFEKSKSGDTASPYEKIDVVFSETDIQRPYYWSHHGLFPLISSETSEPKPLRTVRFA